VAPAIVRGYIDGCVMEYDSHGFATAEDGTRLFYGVRGEGTPLVLCDGLGCDGFAWKYLQPHFSASHRVIHWHYRGHGRSGSPNDPARVDVPALARDLRAVLDHLGIDRAVFVGHSLGTQVQLELHRIAPERVQSHVLVCGSYGKITHTFHGSDMLKQVLPSLIEAVQKHRSLARALWGRVPAGLAYRMATMSREVDALAIREEDFRHYWEHVSVMDPDVFLAMLRLAGEHSAEDVLARITVPALVIAAERDTFTPPELATHMAEQIPGAELMLVRGGSHAAPVEQPVAMQMRIDEFLRSAAREAQAASTGAHPASAQASGQRSSG
jgi:pimeloyl-ACP methyl ester carboxylesterase